MYVCLSLRTNKALSIVFEHLAPVCADGRACLPWTLGPAPSPWPVATSHLSAEDLWHRPPAQQVRASSSGPGQADVGTHAPHHPSFSESEEALLRRFHLPKLRGLLRAGVPDKAGQLGDHIITRIAPLSYHHQESVLTDLCRTLAAVFASDALPASLISTLLARIQAGQVQDKATAGLFVTSIIKRLSDPTLAGLREHVLSVLPRVVQGLTAHQAITCMHRMVKHDCCDKPVFELLSTRLADPGSWAGLPLDLIMDLGWACAHSRHVPQPMWAHLVKAVHTRISDMTSQQVSHMHWVLSQLPAAPEPELMAALQHAATRMVPEGDTQTLAQLAWNLASMEEQEARRMLPQILHKGAAFSHVMTLEQLVTLLYTGAVHRKQANPHLVQCICARVSSQEPHHVAELASCEPGVLVRLFWATSKMKYQDSGTTEVLAARLTTLGADGVLTPREVGMLVDACWYLQYHNSDFIETLLQSVSDVEVAPSNAEPQGNQLDVVTATKLLRSLGNLKHYTPVFVEALMQRVLDVLGAAVHPHTPTRLAHLVDAAALLHPVLPANMWQQLLRALERSLENSRHRRVNWGAREVAIAIKGMSWLWVHEDAWMPSQHLVLGSLLNMAQKYLAVMKAGEVMEIVQALVRMRHVPPASIQKDLLQCLLGKVMDDKHVGVPEVAELLCSWGMHLSGPQGQDLALVLQSCLHLMPLEMLERLGRCCLHTPWPNAGHKALLQLVITRSSHLVRSRLPAVSAPREAACDVSDADVGSLSVDAGKGDVGEAQDVPAQAQPDSVLLKLWVLANQCQGKVLGAEGLCHQLLPLVESLKRSADSAGSPAS